MAARVHGPVDFTVLAFWALGPAWVESRLTYAAQASRVIDQVLPQLEGHVVFAGDFNAPVLSNATDTRRHEGNDAALAAHSLVSAFSAARPSVDPLTEPTVYHQRNAPSRPTSTTLFVPAVWTPRATVLVGK